MVRRPLRDRDAGMPRPETDSRGGGGADGGGGERGGGEDVVEAAAEGRAEDGAGRLGPGAEGGHVRERVGRGGGRTGSRGGGPEGRPG